MPIFGLAETGESSSVAGRIRTFATLEGVSPRLLVWAASGSGSAGIRLERPRPASSAGFVSGAAADALETSWTVDRHVPAERCKRAGLKRSSEPNFSVAPSSVMPMILNVTFR